MDKFPVSAVVSESAFGNTDKNIASCRYWVEKAAENGSRIICFPELSISGYRLCPGIEGAALKVPGKETDEIHAIARKHGVLILAGLIEKAIDGNYISHVAVGPEGIIGIYRKVHLSPPEKEYFIPGNQIPVFKWQDVFFSIGLCFDAHFPEFASVCSLKGAQILFFPHASPPPETADEKKERWLRYLPARAYDNSVYVVACNQVGALERGVNFRGVAIIAGPKGEILAEVCGDKPAHIQTDLIMSDLEKIHNSKMGYFLGERRPDLYTQLTEPKKDS